MRRLVVRNASASHVPHRKEVIQPHLPIRLPCYDFTPNHRPHLRRLAPFGYPTGFGCYQLSWCDGRCVQGPGTYSPQYADLRLLAIPTSSSRPASCLPYELRFSLFGLLFLLPFPFPLFFFVFVCL